MRPRFGCRHLTSASTPIVLPTRRSILGWKWRTSSSCPMACRSSAVSSSRAASWSSCRGAYTAYPRPARLAMYIATSARRSRVSASWPWSGYTAMPMLALAWMLRSTIAKGRSSAARIFLAVIAPPSLPASPAGRTANSSPPRRAIVSEGLRRLSRRSATCCSNWSPTSCPRVSFTSLKPFMSMTSRVTDFLSRCAVRMAWRSRSFSKVRFGRPVRTSCRARYSSVSLIGDVPQYADEAPFAAQEHFGGAEFDRERGPVLAAAPHLARTRGRGRIPSRPHMAGEEARELPLIGLRHEQLGLAAQDLVRRVAEEPLGGPVERFDEATFIGHHDTVGDIVEHRVDVLHALLQRLLGALPLDHLPDLPSDVGHHSEEAAIRLAGVQAEEGDDAGHGPPVEDRKRDGGAPTAMGRRGGADQGRVSGPVGRPSRP